MKCTNCNGDVHGDGLTSVHHCEYTNESDYEFAAPDEGPFYCDYVERMYGIQAINSKTGKVTKLNLTPMTHDKACTMLSKFNKNEGRHMELYEL